MQWWQDVSYVERYVRDFVRAELSLLRPGQAILPASAWQPQTSLIEDLGMDSLEMMSVASALVQAVHLDESGIEDYLLARFTIAEWTAIVSHGLNVFSARLTFGTSGSTGTPKSCTHALAALVQEAEALAALYEGRKRIVSLVPSHHIYGFLHTVLLPQMMKEPALQVLDGRNTTAPKLVGMLNDGDLLIGYPDWWRMALRTGARFTSGVHGTTSSAPCAADLHAGVLQAGLGRLVDVFGSSETAGLGWRDQPDTPYRLFPHWRRNLSTGAVERTLADRTVMRAQMQDELAWPSHQHFTPKGRVDDAVQVGGINVFPARVREILMAHPLVRDAAVRLMQPHEGTRLKAYIVLRDGTQATPEVLHCMEEWARARLTTCEIPRSYTFGVTLPGNELGKLSDWAIDSPAPAWAS